MASPGSLLASMALVFPGVSPASAAFLTISLILVITFCVTVGTFFAVRYVSRSSSPVAIPPPSQPVPASASQRLVSQPTTPTNASDGIQITCDTDLEAATGAKVNELTEQDMMAAMTDSVREAYLKLVGEYKAPAPVEPMFPEGPRPKCREFKDEVCEKGCFCKSTLGQIAGYGRNSVESINIDASVFGSSSRVHPPAHAHYGPTSYINTYRYSTASDSTSSSSDVYVSVPDVSLSRPASQSSYATADSTLSVDGITFHAPVRNTPSQPLVTRPASIACYDAIPRQHRASASVGVKPLMLVQKYNSQPTHYSMDSAPATKKVLGNATNRNSTVIYHDTTVSRIVKIGGGKRHRDARPATLGY